MNPTSADSVVPSQLPVQPPQAPALPQLAVRFGYAGLLPFAVSAGMIWLLHREDQLAFVALALLAWAALIVSFMSAIPWAIAMLRPELGERPYGFASLMSGLAWVALLMPAYAGLVVAGVLLVTGYLHDRRFYLRCGLASWLTLRFRLSLTAAFFCFLGAAGV